MPVLEHRGLFAAEPARRLPFRQRLVGLFVARNLLDEEYFEQLLAAPAGNGAGHYGAVLGDPVAYGATLRFSF
jgi:hypothetical protein